MPIGLDPITAGIGLVSAVPSFIAGIDQRLAANRVKLQNTETNAEREALGMSRQAANASRMPGMGARLNRLGQGQNNVMQAARLGAGSSGDFLAAAGAADARRIQGEQALADQSLAYQDAGKQQLRRDLTTQSQRQQHDLDVYNQQKGALTQASATNLNNGVGTLASYGAAAYNMKREDNRIGAGGSYFDGGVTPQLDMSGGVGAFPGSPEYLPNRAGRYPGIPSLGTRRYSGLGYSPQ